jgi:hypothetical protein
VYEVVDAAELLGLGELVDVRFLEFSASLLDAPREDFEPDDVHQSMDIMLGVSQGAIEVRVTMHVATKVATFAGVAATQFRHNPDVSVTPQVAQEFAERVGVMSVYPYLRELVQSSSTRLRVDALTLPLLRPENVQLSEVPAANSETAE